MEKIIITFDSVTYANKAKKILSKAAINTKLVKVSSEISKGCTYGIEISSGAFFDVVNELKKANINYAVYNQ